MKKYAWTMIELIVALTIVFVITMSLIGVYKPNTQKSKIYLYSAIRNIMKANIGVVEKYNNDGSGDGLFYQKSADSTNNTYCLTMADMLSLKSAASCAKNAAATTTNLVLANGIEIRGLTSAERTPFTGAAYTFKDIVVDIDGFGTGVNRIWADQFPLRIYSDGDYDANIQPVNCSGDNETVYKEDGSTVTIAKNQYCGSKKINYQSDKTQLSYDVISYVESDDPEKLAKGKLVANGLSAFEADCLAYGGIGFFHAKQCHAAGYKMLVPCASDDTCVNCVAATSNVCPAGATSVSVAGCKAVNATKSKCITKLHKPSGGMNIVLETLVGDMDEL